VNGPGGPERPRLSELEVVLMRVALLLAMCVVLGCDSGSGATRSLVPPGSQSRADGGCPDAGFDAGLADARQALQEPPGSAQDAGPGDAAPCAPLAAPDAGPGERGTEDTLPPDALRLEGGGAGDGGQPPPPDAAPDVTPCRGCMQNGVCNPRGLNDPTGEVCGTDGAACVSCPLVCVPTGGGPSEMPVCGAGSWYQGHRVACRAGKCALDPAEVATTGGPFGNGQTHCCANQGCSWPPSACESPRPIMAP